LFKRILFTKLYSHYINSTIIYVHIMYDILSSTYITTSFVHYLETSHILSSFWEWAPRIGTSKLYLMLTWPYMITYLYNILEFIVKIFVNCQLQRGDNTIIFYAPCGVITDQLSFFCLLKCIQSQISIKLGYLNKKSE